MAGAAFGANPFGAVPSPSTVQPTQPFSPSPRAAAPPAGFMGTTTPASMPASNSLPGASSGVNQVSPTAFNPPPAAPAPPSTSNTLQNPGGTTNPGYGEQALLQTQNRLQEDPFQSTFQNAANQAQQPSAGESYLNNNLGTLDGPGQGEQYWNQVQGQFNDPFAGEQFARQATQQMNPNGPASQFFNQAMGQYNNFTGYQGPQNTQGQFQQNAASGPLAGQQFYNQVGGQYDSTGRYTDPNLAAGQYAQTQNSFGALPTPNSADPFYDRSIQLGTQAYNNDAASRGVYGSSQALSGVGNVITDLNAKRAQNAFQNDMSIAQENRARQQLLGEQARQGDLSSLSGFGANLSGVETFGNLANMAGNQTLGQQSMLGAQANAADTQALGAQNSNISGLNTFGNLSGQADTSQTNRFNATTGAMNAADKTALDRLGLGADVAFRADDSARNDFTASTNAATASGNLENSRNNTAINAASAGSSADLSRLNSYNSAATGADTERRTRDENKGRDILAAAKQVTADLSDSDMARLQGDQAAQDDYVNAQIAKAKTEFGMSDADANAYGQGIRDTINSAAAGKSLAS